MNAKFKPLDVDTELQNLQCPSPKAPKLPKALETEGKLSQRTPPKAPKAPETEENFSHFSHFRWLTPLKAGNSSCPYCQTAKSISEDCFTIDPIWLAEKHPELWLRMALIDYQLTKIEQQRAEQGEYESMLEKLVQTVKKARALYEQESQRRGAVQ